MIDHNPWDMAALSKPPPFIEAPAYGTRGIRALFYDALPYKNNPTRTFAYYGCPAVEPGKKVPAMVLVHGGGGSAFIAWVELWVRRGYAAISMDTCGCINGGIPTKHSSHDMGGPPGWGGFEQMGEALHDQWTYHAVADVILAHSLIRSFKEVDAARIGLTGISWGGYLACLAASVDHRFRFAAPVYGCGFLEDSVLLEDAIKATSLSSASDWLAQWDPSHYLQRVTMPMLWLTGTNDFAFSLRALQKSYRLPAGAHTLSIHLRMIHGHGGHGENPEETHAFANCLLRNKAPLVTISEVKRIERTVHIHFTGGVPIVDCQLLFTRDTCPWADRHWESTQAHLEKESSFVELPRGTVAYYLNLIDERNLTVSSEHEEL